jgi:hypothetical protein
LFSGLGDRHMISGLVTRVYIIGAHLCGVSRKEGLDDTTPSFPKQIPRMGVKAPDWRRDESNRDRGLGKGVTSNEARICRDYHYEW